MVIRMKSLEGPNLTIPLPTALVLNPITAKIAAHQSDLNFRQLNRLFQTIRACKKQHPDWVLAEVRSADGTKITIRP